MKTSLFTLFLLLSFFGQLSGEEETRKAEEKTPELVYQLVVSASRAPQSSRELGSSLTVLPGTSFGSEAADLLSRLYSVPGLSFTQSGSFGQPASVFIRGANSEHTLVLIDGIEINDPSSTSRTFDFGGMSMNEVERIEVLRGAQSPLYGSNAIGGVVQIITKNADKEGFSFHLGGEIGRYDSFREHMSVSGRNDKGSFNLGVSRYDSKGFSAAAAAFGNQERDGIGQNQINLKGDLSLVENLKLGLTARFTRADIDLDSSAGAGGDDPNYTAENGHLLLAVRGEWKTRPERWKQSLNLSYQDTSRAYDDPSDALHPSDSSIGEYKAQILKLNWQNEITISGGADLVAGIEWQQERAESTYSYTSAWGDGNSDFPRVSASTLSAYSSFNLDLSSRLYINAGLRFDQHEEFGGQLSLKLSPAFFITPTTKLMASVSNGFKSPSLYQLYAPATLWGPVGNEGLNPETALTLDFGLQQSFLDYRFTIETSVFFNRYRNLIDYDYSQGYINIKKARSRGFEASISYRPDTRFQVAGSYTYTDAVDEDIELPLLRRPKHRFSLGASWHILSNLFLSADLSRVGKREDIYPYPDRMICNAYTLVSAGCEWKLIKSLKLFFRMENIGNVQYQSVAGYGTAGRSAFLGAQLDL